MAEKADVSNEEFDNVESETPQVEENTTELQEVIKYTRTPSIPDSSVDSSSVVDSEDLADEFQQIEINNKNGEVLVNPADLSFLNEIGAQQAIITPNTNFQSSNSVQIQNSSDIIIGNVTYLTGPIYVTKTEGGNIGILNQTKIKTSEKDDSNQNNTPAQEPVLRIISRKGWFAFKPLEPYDYITEPVPYVVISHTASEVPLTKRESIELVRNVQAYHVNSRRWNDIGYNFLIGGCGYAYEGRGWGIVGAHTYGYNKRAMGISFIGCFMNELPPQISLNACQLLIRKGVEEGHISADYKLVAHCQCSATESPGRMLYDVIKTWPHFVSGSKITDHL